MLSAKQWSTEIQVRRQQYVRKNLEEMFPDSQI